MKGSSIILLKSNFYKFFQNIKNAIFVKLILVFNITFFSIGCDVVYKFLDKEGAEEKELVGEVILYEKNPTVEEIQILLKLYGYDPGGIDGILGARTRGAIQRFQIDNDLKDTKFVDQATWKKLRVFRENDLVKETELNVKLVQELLIKAGYNPGKVDGKMGPKTKTAVKSFQKNQNLKVDGKVGYKTLTRLSYFLSVE